MGVRLRRAQLPGRYSYVTLVPLIAAVVLGTSLTACGSTRSDGPSASAAGFYAALTAGDGAGACAFLTTHLSEELAESGDCGSALLQEQLPSAGAVTNVAVYGSAAQVTLVDDVVFLNDAGGRWEVTAAGCTARPDQPYRCRIGG